MARATLNAQAGFGWRKRDEIVVPGMIGERRCKRDRPGFLIPGADLEVPEPWGN